MKDLALILWVALIGADRIDLLGGEGPIVLTPYFLLTPLVIWQEALRRRRRGESILPRIPERGSTYASCLLALLSTAGLSVLVSRDVTTSVGRLTLLIAIACGSGLVLWSIWDDPRWRDRLAQGAQWGLVLSAAVSGLEIAQFLGQVPAEWSVGPVRLRLDPYTYSGILPRISGPTLDPNRAGLVLLLQWALVPRSLRNRRWAILSSLLLLGTLSRSALLAALAYLLFRTRNIDARELPRRRSPRMGLPLTVAVSALALLVSPVSRERLGRFLAPVGQRLSISEGSAQSHTALIRQGIAEATRNVERTLSGVGYGTSYLLLRDRFGGNRYGNFHSLYVTLWVESGIFGLLFLSLLLLRPLTLSGEWRPLLLGAILFNLFYQASTDAAFWAIIALAWSAPPSPTPSGRDDSAPLHLL